MARRKQADENTARVRNLLALDAANIMRRLEARRGEMFVLFSRLRSREPMLSTISTRYTSATFHELVHLPILEQSVVDHFYECLDVLCWRSRGSAEIWTGKPEECRGCGIPVRGEAQRLDFAFLVVAASSASRRR